MRQSHTKSRFGCQQCKRRKVKCDENKPTCNRCSARRQQCSYVVSSPRLPTASRLSVPASVDGSVLDPYSTNASLTPEPLDGAPSIASPCRELTESAFEAERFSLLHLELFDHLKSHMLGVTLDTSPEFDHVLQLAYSEGFRAPYLMDEMLALTAAHKSTMVKEDLRELYRSASTKLQNRAISQVTHGRGIATDDNPTALFIFSALLGQHVLFDICTSTSSSLPTILDKIVQCFDLHSGIRVIASQSLDKIHPMFSQRALDDYSHDSTTSSPASNGATECSTLMGRLKDSGLEQQTLDVYTETVEILQKMFDSVRNQRERLPMVVQEWLVRVSPDYITRLRQRRPEALVIFTHYAALLHLARDHWVVNGSGRFLIESIASHLGDYWSGWLEWPQRLLEQG